MVIYGTRSAHLKTESFPTTDCPDCKSTGTINYSIFRKHMHIFYIPIFPIVKIGWASCSHCGKLTELKNMTRELAEECKEVKRTSKGPIWQYAGVPILTFLLVFAYYGHTNRMENEQEYLAHPKLGDTYSFVTKQDWFSLMKVTDLSEDSIFVSINDYEVDMKSATDGIDKDQNYPDYYVGYSRSDIKDLYEEGTIYEINRYGSGL